MIKTLTLFLLINIISILNIDITIIPDKEYTTIMKKEIDKINKISDYIMYIRIILLLFIIAIFITVGQGCLSFNIFTTFILIIFLLFNLYIRNNLTLRNIIIVRITDLILILIAFTTLLFLFIIKIL